MSVVQERISPVPELAPEDRARAEHYALLSRLFVSAPDTAFLQSLTAMATALGNTDSTLGLAWQEMSEAALATNAEALDEEYTQTFLTIGRPEIMLFGSFYMAGFMMETPVVELREDLAEMGLGRRFGITESEDHFSALCDVMRHLILTGPDAPGLARQQLFFARHLAPWVDALADALEKAPTAVFYSRTAPLLRAFFDVERLAFDML